MKEGRIKQCKDCGRSFPETRDYFGQYKNARNGIVKIGYRNQCRECMAENTKRHSQDNPEQVHERSQRRRAHALNQTTEISEQRCAQLILILESKCRYCEETLDGGYEVDHLTPLSRGGSNKDKNITLACLACNRAKGSKTLWEFEEWRRERRLHVRVVNVKGEAPDAPNSDTLRNDYQ